MTNPTLANIRHAKTFDDLKPAIKFLCDNMQAMTWGEFCAYKRVLEAQAGRVGTSVAEMNKYAEQYQLFGYEIKE